MVCNASADTALSWLDHSSTKCSVVRDLPFFTLPFATLTNSPRFTRRAWRRCWRLETTAKMSTSGRRSDTRRYVYVLVSHCAVVRSCSECTCMGDTRHWSIQVLPPRVCQQGLPRSVLRCINTFRIVRNSTRKSRNSKARKSDEWRSAWTSCGVSRMATDRSTATLNR